MDLLKELIRVDQVMGEDSSETLVESDIILSDNNPDFKQILTVDGSVVINSTEILQDRVIIDGTVNFNILYISDDEEKSIRSMESKSNFNHSMDMLGIKPKMRADLFAEIQHVDYEVANKRKITVKSVIDLDVRITEEIEVEVIKDITGIEDLQLLQEEVSIINHVGENKSQTIVKEDLEIPDDKPSVKDILKTNVKIKETESKVSEDKVIVQGMIILNTLYLADNEELSLENVQHQIPFTHFVEIQYASAGMQSTVNFSLDEVLVDIKDNIIGEPRIFDTEVVLTISSKVEEYYNVNVITDCYSISERLDTDTKFLKLREEAGRQEVEAEFKETIQLSDEQLTIKNIHSIDSRVVVTDYNIAQEQVIIEGIIDSDIVFTTNNEENSINSISNEMPFSYSVDMIGIIDGMNVDIIADIVNAEAKSVSYEEIETVFNITFDVNAVKTIEKKVVVSVALLDEEQQMKRSCISIYFVQPGDTLWDIAKNYNTTVEEICFINEIEEPVTPGTKILLYGGGAKYNIS